MGANRADISWQPAVMTGNCGEDDWHLKFEKDLRTTTKRLSRVTLWLPTFLVTSKLNDSPNWASRNL